jgi:hypothetical protein
MWDGAELRSRAGVRYRIESRLSLSYREQALDGDILVDVGPVNPNTTTDEAPIAALGFGRLR